MIGESTYRIESDPTSPQDQYIVKQTIMSLDQVEFEQDPDGTLTITEAPAAEVPAAAPPKPRKYELEAEGEMFRLVALRTVGGIFAGQRGGLVSGPAVLSHGGNCWIDASSTVRGEWRVTGDAHIRSCQLDGYGLVSSSHLTRVTVNSNGHGHISIVNADMADVTLNTGSSLTIKAAHITHSVIYSHGEGYAIVGGKIDGGELHHRYEVVSVHTAHGWLSAFRGRDDENGNAGQLRIAVGCQRFSNFAAFRAYATRYLGNSDAVELDMLTGFEAMVATAQKRWTKSADQIAAELVASQQKAAAEAAQSPVSFKDLAERARDASQMPEPVLRRATLDEVDDDVRPAGQRW